MIKLLIRAMLTAAVLGVAAGRAVAHPGGAGVQAAAVLTQDYFRDVRGGRRRGGAGPGNVFLRLDLHGRVWGGPPSDLVRLRVLGTFGGSISNQVGDLQGLDNVAAPDAVKLYSAWYQHRFGDSGVSTRLGLQDYNALFNTLAAASVLINSSFGLPATIAQSNVPVYPTTAVGAVLRWHSRHGAYAMGGVYNGRPGDPQEPGGTHLHLDPGSGLFYAFEAGLGGGPRRGKLGIGGWYQTSDYTDPGGITRDRNHGVYVIAETPLARVSSGAAWSGFVQLGVARPGTNTIGRYLGVGIDVENPLPGRPHDRFSLGVARARTTAAYRRATAAASNAETVVEATYRAALGPHFSLQPDLQYVSDPGASARLGNAWVVGLRAQASW